ncbi:MAG: tetratricopeptide repeat protein, partial [Deltaproteobacteria bacterium]|nr:tetratricopeptide repeat protein [Kofleriaceae bacterium]
MRSFAIVTFTVAAALSLASPPSARGDDRPPPSKEEVKTAQAHFDAGRRLIKKGKYPEAIKELEAAFALDPKNEQLFNLGVAHHLNKDLKAAADFYRRFLAVETKGRTVQTARKHLEQIEKVLAGEAAVEQARADAQRKLDDQRLAEEQRVKALRDAEDRERVATAKVAELEAELARAKLARDTQRTKVDGMRGEAEGAE